uniref:Uncharacterized protein n=1 Tax=Candidatus Kentrum sp. FW TaxID=2126338 RepID=A0A450TKY9_9GAMM|nr:MAG: hypothetical protein BECKFW1821B_GA0114236_11439 [Candidatus Kentron sp. FW]
MIGPADDHQFDEKKPAADVKAHHPKMLLFLIDSLLTKENLPHNPIDILAIDDLDFFVFRDFDVHAALLEKFRI